MNSKLGYIYMIKNKKEHRNKVNNKYVYIGSTSMDNIKDRFEFHKVCLKSGNGSKFYTTLREQGIDNFKIKRIETVMGGGDLTDIECKKALLKRERFYYDTYLNISKNAKEFEFLNTNKPMRTKEEKENNYKLNKQKFIENALRYYYDNLDAKRAYQRQYNENNKEVIKAKYDAKNIDIECECGCVIKKFSLKSHLRSNKHNTLIQAL